MMAIEKAGKIFHTGAELQERLEGWQRVEAKLMLLFLQEDHPASDGEIYTDCQSERPVWLSSGR